MIMFKKAIHFHNSKLIDQINKLFTIIYEIIFDQQSYYDL